MIKPSPTVSIQTIVQNDEIVCNHKNMMHCGDGAGIRTCRWPDFSAQRTKRADVDFLLYVKERQ